MFRLLAENVKDYAIFVVDPHRHILSWSKGAERLLGFSEQEIIGRQCDCFFTPEDVERGVPQMELEQALLTGRGEDDRWHMRKDGSRFWASGAVTPLKDEVGRLRGFAKIMRDRTELKLAEEAARDRERQLHLLTDHAPVLIAHCDTERRYKFVNKPYAARFGLHPREVVGRRICDVLGGPAYSAIERYVDTVLAGERVEFEVEIPYDGQGPQTMRCSYDPELDAEGRVEGFVAAIINVTESRRAEAALAANRRRLQAIFDTSLDAILLADNQAQYVDANPAACTLLGYAREELLRRGVFDITPPSDAGAGRNAWEAFLRDGKQSGEYMVSQKDGTQVVVEFRAVANVQPGLHLSVLRDVTERKRAEAVLRQSEALLHRILGSNAIGLIVADFRGNVVQANDAFLEIIGYDRADLDAGQVNFMALTPEEYRPLDQRAVDEMKRAGRHVPFEKEYVRKDGSRVPVLVGTAHLGGERGDDRGIGFIIDLTEQKRASAALRESEERLRTLSDNLPQGAIYQTLGDLEGHRRFLYISAGVERLFGVTPAEALADAHTLYGLVHEGDRARVAAAEEVALRGHAPFDCEFRSWTRTGELRWAHARSAPRRIPTGETVWEGIILDVTARRRAEEALRESEARFRAIFDQTIAGVAQTDLTGQFVLVNQRYCEIVRRAPEELYGLRMQAITHLDDVSCNAERFGDMVQGGQPFVIEKRYVLPDGSHVWVNNSVSLVRDEEGHPKYTVAIVLDVTERKRVEQERDRLIAVIEYSPDFIGIADLDQRAFFLNRAGQRLVGLDGPEEVRRTAVLDYFPEGERERVRREIMPVLLEKGHWDGEIDFSHFRTGERIPVRWNVFTLPDPATGQPAFFACVSRDIREQKRAEAALRQSELRYRLVGQAANDAIWDWDLATNRATWHEGVRQLFGYAPEQIGPDPTWWYENIHPDDRERVVHGIHAAIDGGQELWRDEYRFRRADGSYAEVFDRGRVVRQGGRPVRMVGSMLDLTERKRIEERLRFTLEATQVGQWELDLVTDTARRSLRHDQIFGYDSPPAAWGYDIFLNRHVHPDDRTDVDRAFREALAAGKEWEFECRVVRTDQALRWIWAKGGVDLTEDGRPRRMVGLVMDVTDRKQAEEAARRRSEQVRRLAEVATRVTADLDVPSLLGVVMEEARVLIGSHQAVASTTIDLNWSQAINAVSLSDQYAAWRSYDARPDGSGIYSLVCRTNRPMRLTQAELESHPAWKAFGAEAGKHPPMRGWLAAPLVGRNGRNLGLIQLSDKYEGEFTEEDEAVLVQLAQMASVAVENARLVESLRDADRRKDEFLATLAHELRNPLAPLRNGLQVMRLARGSPEVVEQTQGMMERQLGTMVRLIDDLLDVSRITRGKLPLRRERVDLASVIQNAIEGSRPLIEASAHQLTVTLPAEPVWLDADPTRLAQVVSNLLTNAAKYTEKAGRIWLTAVRHGGEVLVSVEDTGIGIAPEHLPKLFEMFSQVAPALERSQGGLGIGLSLVKGLVEMHGGRVEAHSKGLGQGSKFIVRLPVTSLHPARETQHNGSGDGETARPRRRILVADDNRDAADSLAMMLRLGGHEVLTTHDGQEAIEAAAWFRPQVALLDIGMPRLNGLDVARRIREEPWGKGIVLVAITGWGQEEDKRRATEAGFDGHLTKPVAPADLEKFLGAGRVLE